MALPHPHKPQRHHKKQHGRHHRHSKHYLKTYHPYLPLVVLIVIGLAINVIWSSPPQVLGVATNLTASELLIDTNMIRANNQQGDLALNKELNAAAQAKANDMAQRNYWSHKTPDGDAPWVFLNDNGYKYQAAGENLAYGFMNADQILTGWMGSKEHKANILNGNFQHVGFGIANARNFQGKGSTTIVVAMYGQPLTAAGSTAGGFSTGDAGAAATTGPYRNVSRVQLLTGGSLPWSFAAVSLITFAAVALFTFRHALAWRRVFATSEAFVLHHKLLDVVIVGVIVAGFLLTRAGGFIG
jgi:uncharacterized protein YkwD